MRALHKYIHFIDSGSYVCLLMDVQERDSFVETSLALRKVSFSKIFINPMNLELNIYSLTHTICVKCEYFMNREWFLFFVFFGAAAERGPWPPYFFEVF